MRYLWREWRWAPAALGAACMALVPPVASAQTPVSAAAESGDTVSFPASFFADSRPTTALDMVRRTPGFSYNAGDRNVRGLSGAAGNVVIDGQPQTSKTVSLDETLTRIPASQVARIDIVRAGAGGVEMSGFAVIANVVRVAGARTEATLTLEPRFYGEGSAADGGARVDWSRRAGALLVSVAAEAKSWKLEDGGEGRIVRTNRAGAVIDAGDFTSVMQDRSAALSGAAEYNAGETLYRANFGYSHVRADRDELAYLATLERFTAEEDSDQGEIGANIEHKFTPTLTGRLDALQTFKQRDRLAGRAGRQTTTEAISGESNLRGSLTLRPREGLSFEAGLEGAFNFLDQESTLTTANANVRVEERRAQPYATMNWRVAPKIALELGARYEKSTITQTGDTDAERSFAYFKPRAIAAIDLSSKTQVRLRVEREVKQLDFNDFAASSGASEGSAAAGNASLQPERAWVYEAAIEQKLWDRAVVVLTYTREQIKEVWDYEQVGATTDGRGNIGEGTRDSIVGDIKIALDPLGVRGGRLEYNPQYYLSEAVDPFTGRARPISGYKRWRGRLSLYLDRPEISSTFATEIGVGNRNWTYRIDQVQLLAQHTFVNVWWEWAPRPRLTIRATANAILDRELHRDRDVYIGSRAADVFSFREERFAAPGTIFMLKIRQGL